jgi:hypothetical protein
VSVGQEDHRGVPLSPSVALGGLDEPVNSEGVRCSLARRSRFGRRRDVTVRSTVPGRTSRRRGLVMEIAPARSITIVTTIIWLQPTLGPVA